MTSTAPISTAQPIAIESWRKRYPGLARFLRNKVAVAALIAIILLLLTAAFGPVLYGRSTAVFNDQFIGNPQPPGNGYPFGIDEQGRDVLSRVLIGARISLSVGIISCIINILIGVTVGTVSGWCYGSTSRWIASVDAILMRIVDVLRSLPLLLVVLLMQVFVNPILTSALGGRQSLPLLLSPDLISIYLALGVTNWLTMARLARGEVLNQSRMEYVMAAQALGQKNFWILFRHVVPNCLGPLTVAATLAIPEAIFIESYLAFVGLGVTAPQASWGTMANDALGYMSSSPHLLLFPAISISITMLAFNLFGDGLRDALDPSSR